MDQITKDQRTTEWRTHADRIPHRCKSHHGICCEIVHIEIKQDHQKRRQKAGTCQEILPRTQPTTEADRPPQRQLTHQVTIYALGQNTNQEETTRKSGASQTLQLVRRNRTAHPPTNTTGARPRGRIRLVTNCEKIHKKVKEQVLKSTPKTMYLGRATGTRTLESIKGRQLTSGSQSDSSSDRSKKKA